VTERTAARLAWAVAIGCWLMAGTSLVLYAMTRTILDSPDANGAGFANIIPAVTFGALGGLVASRQPRNPIGWLMLAIATGTGVTALAFYIAKRELVTGAAATGSVRWVAWVETWPSGLALGSLILLILLFPTGHLLTTRWRWAGRIAVAFAIVFSAGIAFDPTPVPVSAGFPNLTNPVGVRALAGFSNSPAFFGIIVLLFVAAIGMLLRLRRSRGDERQQLKWFVYATGVSVAALLLSVPASFISNSLGNTMANLAFNLGFAFAVPAAAALAILRYGLYEIDVVINKTVLYASLAAFFSAVYVAVVVGIGSVIGSTHNTFLTLLAAALIALAFNPVRQRAKRLADRAVYGKRATPYEVLSEFSEELAGSYALDDILPRMAKVLAEGTGGAAEVWLRVGRILRRAASWPEAPLTGEEVVLIGDELPAYPAASKAVAVRDQGELLGALTVTKPPSDPLRPAEEKLIDDLAAQGGLVLRNARLNAELVARLEELQASRQRLVTAQDEERRKLERNIHDGAQQQLVALSVKLRLLGSLAKRDPDKAESLAAELQVDSSEALENLRDLARGIYPPLLADKGLAAALGSAARKSPVPVIVESDGIGRHPQDVEAAVYFCCLEALQNIAKYAEASNALVRLSDGSGSVSFEVIDDGLGFDPASVGYGTGLQGMADRLEALGGSLEVRSQPDHGTTVAGRVPAE
jgi:signal transduction histidine kinase